MKNENQHSDPTDALIIQSLAKLDGKALGVAIGLLLGIGIFVATNFLIFKGGHVIGPNLALLSQFFIGYEITLKGSVIGMIYGMMAGFIIGWLIAAIRNLVLTIYMNLIKVKSSMSAVNDFLDNP